MVKIGLEGAAPFLREDRPLYGEAKDALSKLNNLEDTGWAALPSGYSSKISGAIKDAARKISGESEAFVVIGIGGSYLGARAAIEFIKSPNYNALPKQTPDIYFAGNNASAEYLSEVIELIGDRNFSVNIVSKSGSTIEPSIALRVFKNLLETRYGSAGLKERLYVTTDKLGSPLRELAAREGYSCFEMPEGVGGRYSVLTAVGLLPAAVAGIDIDGLMSGALEEMNTGSDAACLYAATRQSLYRNGKKIELLACFEPAFRYTGEWWKQLFGESEGKAGIGIFPAFTEYTADLHSLGQYIQEGERTLMETFVTINAPRVNLEIPGGSEHSDKLSTLAGRCMHEVNHSASEAVKKAHIDGGVPVIELSIPEFSAASFGALVYFFERSCAVSALISGVNPFGQPGVEAYKKNLYSILGLH